MTKTINTDHPNFRRCYNEGVAAQTTGGSNPYVPGTDEAYFFEAGVEGKQFHDEKVQRKTASTDVSSDPVTLINSGDAITLASPKVTDDEIPF